MSTSASTLKSFRLLHRYLGLFIAPALLFFAFTGAIQTLSLHEGAKGSSYKPPAWIATLAQIHKHQTTTASRPQGPTEKRKSDGDKAADSPATAPVAANAKVPDAPTTSLPTAKWKMHLPLKIFFLIVSLGLFVSTLTGIYMALKYGGSKLIVWTLLLAGTTIPLVLMQI